MVVIEIGDMIAVKTKSIISMLFAVSIVALTLVVLSSLA